MSNLFSIFDPVAFGGMSWNWMSAILAPLLFPAKFWKSHSQFSFSLTRLLGYLFKEFSTVIWARSVSGFLFIPLSLFFYIWANNFLGLLPYVFTSTSHLSAALSLSLPLWLGHMILASVKNSTSMLAHLVPKGSPAGLSPFMVCVELVSSCIRPITLSIRLAANMVAGHLLLTLLSSMAGALSSVTILVVVSLSMLMILELAVATIQAYVFSTLNILYLNEVNTLKIL